MNDEDKGYRITWKERVRRKCHVKRRAVSWTNKTNPFLGFFNRLFLVLAGLAVVLASFPPLLRCCCLSVCLPVCVYCVFFVMQDNVHHASLTVRQTLAFAAKLRMPCTVTAKDREKRVAAMVTMLGLEGVCCGGVVSAEIYREGKEWEVDS